MCIRVTAAPTLSQTSIIVHWCTGNSNLLPNPAGGISPFSLTFSKPLVIVRNLTLTITYRQAHISNFVNTGVKTLV